MNTGEHKLRDEDIQHLRHWISKQPHLPQEHDDAWLRKFLYGCKFDLERCKKTLDKYYSIRNVAPEIFSDRDPTATVIRNDLKNAAGLFLPTIVNGDYCVAFGMILCSDAKNLDAEIATKRFFLSVDYLLKEETCSGIVLVVNVQGFTLAHMFKFTPTLLKHTFDCLQGCYPLSLKEIHFVNAPSYIDAIISTIKPYLKEKMRNRIHIHQNLKSLHEYIPQKVLPVEVGGTGGTIQQMSDAWQKKLESKKDWFIEEEKKKTDESKRQGEFPYSDIGIQFGIEGSFRKLNLD